jgi:hypothetical protein
MMTTTHTQLISDALQRWRSWMDTPGPDTYDELHEIFVDLEKGYEAEPDLLAELGRAIAHAQAKHKPYNSFHESYAVILEETDEYWEQVKAWPKAHDPAEMRKELLHIAATAMRSIIDLGL